MANLSELVGSTDVLGTRAAAQERLAERRRALITNLSKAQPTGRAQAGAAVGAALGQALGAAGAAALGVSDVDPEVARVESNAALAKEIQALGTGDNAIAPGTSAYMAAAGQKAQAAGRTDLALQFAEQSAALKVRESALIAKSEKEAAEAERSAFNGLPSATKLSVTATDPARVQRVLGLTEAQAKIVSKDAADTLKTLQAKNQKALDELNAVKTTKSSSEDITQTEGLLLNMGIGGHTFEASFPLLGKDDPVRSTNFARLMDQQATAEIDIAARKGSGVRLTKAEIYKEIMEELEATGGVEGWGTDDVTDIDLKKLGTILKARKAEAPTKQSSTAPTRRRVVAQP